MWIVLFLSSPISQRRMGEAIRLRSQIVLGVCPVKWQRLTLVGQVPRAISLGWNGIGQTPRTSKRLPRLKIQALDQVDPEDGSWQARWRRWQQAMERVEGDMPGTASVLGWAMYEAGLYAEAGEVVAGADAADPLVAWLQAHLLLRDGDRASAITLLQRAAATSDDPAYAVTLGHQLVRADRYEEALAAFLQAAAWPDVAWVAEQILSVAELETVVASWPLDFGVPPAEDADLSAASHAPRSWLLDYRRAQDVRCERQDGVFERHTEQATFL